MLPCFSSQEITLSSARGMLHQSNFTISCHTMSAFSVTVHIIGEPECSLSYIHRLSLSRLLILS